MNLPLQEPAEEYRTVIQSTPSGEEDRWRCQLFLGAQPISTVSVHSLSALFQRARLLRRAAEAEDPLPVPERPRRTPQARPVASSTS